jgi:hypothetical protein
VSDWLEHEPHWARQLSAAIRELTVRLAVALPRLEVKSNITHDLLGVLITDQDHLNTDIQSLATDFAAIIQALKDTPPATPLDFTAADALVASVHAAVPAAPVTEPVTEPVTDPTAPVDGGTSVAS